MKPIRLVFFFLTIVLFWGNHAFSQVINVPAGNTPALINAINTANGNAAPATINLGGGTYVLTTVEDNSFGDSGLPAITGNTTINGNGAQITRSNIAPQFRIMIFDGGDAIVLTVNDLTLSNGDSAGIGGGFVHNGSGTVNMNNCTILNNAANTVGNGIVLNALGGGILNINNCNILDNDGTGNGAGVSNNSPDENGILNITNSTIADNDNTGGFGAGGVHNNSSGTVNISESLIVNNTTTARGGGVNNNGDGPFNITNTTIKDNFAQEFGGGIYNNQDGVVTIDSSTIVGNIAPEGRDIFDDPADPGDINIINTIVGDTVGEANCNASPDIISEGFNIDSGNTCNFNNAGDMVNTNPLLTALADNGGPTETCAPLPNSPAINNGNPACPPPDTDQRGIIRPQGNRCDIGAVETIQPASQVPTLSEWGLIAMAGILGLVGFMVLRIRKVTA